MGVSLPGVHRCFTMRNPLVKALVLAASMFLLCAIMVHSDAFDERIVVIKTATPDRDGASSQRPMGNHYHEAWGEGQRAPTEVDSHTDAAAVTSSSSNSSHVMNCDYNMTQLAAWQSKYSLQNKFEYTKRYIRIVPRNIRRQTMTKVRQGFLQEQIKIVDTSKNYRAETCPGPLMVPVTKYLFPSTANASEFMFGVSTTYRRLMDLRAAVIDEWSYWLTDGNGTSNGGKLILMLLEASKDELEEVSGKLRNVGIDVDVYLSDSTLVMAARYLTLVPTMYAHPERVGKKWIVTCDDDTFFPFMHELVNRFHQFDANKPMYVGTFSEDVSNIERHGSQAFGGAGVFLSMPAAKQVTESYNSCRSEAKIEEANSGWGAQGDILLRNCIYDNSDTKLTLLNDLWQLDLFGDPSGFYESGIKPLSLHHYRGGGWHLALPSQYAKVASVCGEDCTLQRFQTADNFIISNGFSVAYYPKGINFDVNQFERTFRPPGEDTGWNLDFALGPQRPSLTQTGRKMSWDLQEANFQEDGSLSQIYVRKHDDWRWKNPDGSAMSDYDGVIELVWLTPRNNN